MSTKKRLIDAYKLEDLLRSNVARYHHKDDVIAAIAGQPTVDAVEVVRCKDCKHYGRIKGLVGLRCDLQDNQIWCKDDFCSYGERREGE